MKKHYPWIFLVLSFFRSSAEETAVVTEHKINVRGQPSFIGEVVTQLEKGDKVTVLEKIPVENPKPGDPASWTKIKLPENTPVWVFARFIKDGKVTASRLNLRAGPGDNYSVLGRLDNGEQVKTIRTVEDWMEIEAPDVAYAFIDSSLIKSDSDTAVAAVPAAAATAAAARETTPEPAPKSIAANQNSSSAGQPSALKPPEEQTPAPTPPPAQAQPEESKPVTVAKVEQQPELAPALRSSEPPQQPAIQQTPAQPIIPPPQSTVINPTPAQPEPLPKVAEPVEQEEQPAPRRVVRREGLVRSTKSIQAPTWFELVHPDTKKTIGYLHDERLEVKLKDYKGLRVVVSGEEAIDPRWPNTPIIELESIDTAPTNP